MKSDIVPLKYMDKYWKKSFEDYEKSLVKKLSGINVVAHMPCESVQIEPSSYNRDMVFKKSKNHLVVFEFQHSRLTCDDLARFALYAYSLSRKYDAYVSLYVVCGPKIRNPISSYELDENNSFNVNIVSLNNYDGDEILDILSNKIIHSEKLNENDLSDLMFLPLMSSKNSIYIQLKKCIELANTIENVDKRKLNMIFHIKSKIFQK